MQNIFKWLIYKSFHILNFFKGQMAESESKTKHHIFSTGLPFLIEWEITCETDKNAAQKSLFYKTPHTTLTLSFTTYI